MPIATRESFEGVRRTLAGLPRALTIAARSSGHVAITRVPDGRVPAELSARIREFERSIPVSLGGGNEFFRVHDREYSRFFASRSSGRPACFVAGVEGRVVGSLCLSISGLVMPSGRVRRAVYVGNLRVAHDVRYGPVLHRLQLAALLWGVSRAWSAFAVVRDSQTTSPSTGRSTRVTPAFRKLASVSRMVIPVERCEMDAERGVVSDEGAVRIAFRRLSAGFIRPLGGDPSRRSEAAPVWLRLPDGSACGCVEDHDRAKRIFDRRGRPMPKRYLSFFGASSDESAVRLVREARRVAAELGDIRLHLITDPPRASAIAVSPDLPGTEVIPMSIHGFSIRPLPHAPWQFHASEI